MSVDLPAPFWPRTQCTSPGRTSRSTPFSARTPEKAFVIPREGVHLDPKAVRRHCTRRLASYKVPFHVVLVSQLPKNSVGKIVRRHLGLAEPETRLVAAS